MQDWMSFVDWVSKSLLGFICLYGVNILREMKNSIDALNEKMAKIIERTEWHSREIEKLEKRMVRIEMNRGDLHD